MNVTIRNLEVSDASYSWKLKNNKGLWKYTDCDTPLPATLESETCAYKAMLEDKKKKCFAILADDEFVGVVKLIYIKDGSACLSTQILRSDMWGHGIATKALDQIIAYGFNELGLDVIYRFINVFNVAMYKIALKQHFTVSGRSMSSQDVVRFFITKTAWKKSSIG